MILSKKTGLYQHPVGKLKLMSKIVNDVDYKKHGRDTPIYQYFFLQDEEGNNFGLSTASRVLRPWEMEEWEQKLITK